MPDHIKIDALFDPYRETWGWIFKGLFFNAIVLLSLTGLLAPIGKLPEIEQFNTSGLSSTVYFNSLSFANFWLFFQQNLTSVPIAEEVFWRFPVFVLVKSNFREFFRNQKLANLILWLSLVIPNFFWALTHDPIITPVFITGLVYGWLIIKTKPSWPWPSVVCHSLSNLSLYLLVKVLQVFGYAPVN